MRTWITSTSIRSSMAWSGMWVIGRIRHFIDWWNGAFIRLIGQEAMQIGSNTKIDWRYRIGDYRIICDIQDGALCVLVIEIGNRREVYR